MTWAGLLVLAIALLFCGCIVTAVSIVSARVSEDERRRAEKGREW